MTDANLSLSRQKADLLQQMSLIPSIIRGKLSCQTYVTSGRSQGPYHILQRWDNGKNKCQRIPKNQLQIIQDGVSGYERFQHLADQFASLCERQTWDNQSSDFKKKFLRFSPPSFPAPAPSSKRRAQK
jgi:hypothetical protein